MVEARVLGERITVILVFYNFMYLLSVASKPPIPISLGPFAHYVRHGGHNSGS